MDCEIINYTQLNFPAVIKEIIMIDNTLFLKKLHGLLNGNSPLMKELLDSLKAQFGVDVKIETRSHDTATHGDIYLIDKNKPKLKVWYKTNWVSSSYHFNEKGKVSGIQPQCEFAAPIIGYINKFCDDKIREAKEERERKEQQIKEKEQQEYTNLVSHFATIIKK